jgi:hypothetical protein
MDVFDLDRSLVSDYERFARSFTQIKAADIRAQVEAIYASKRFWPEPLISINPKKSCRVHPKRPIKFLPLVSTADAMQLRMSWSSFPHLPDPTPFVRCGGSRS